MSKQERTSFQASVIVGAFTGGIEAFLIHPLVTIKTVLQKGDSIAWNNFVPKNLTTTEITYKTSQSINFMYRGVNAHVFGMSSIIALRMTVRDSVVRYGFKTDNPDFKQALLGSYAGGTFSALVTSPMELGMTLQQTTRHNAHVPNFLESCRAVAQTWGWRKCFTGITCVALRDGIVTSGFLTFTPQFKSYLGQKYKLGDVSAAAIAGGIVGIGCATVTHPLDTIKTIQQVNLRDSELKKGSSIVGATKQIIAKDGISGLYRGVFFRTLRVAPHVATVSFVADKLTNLWHKNAPKF